MCQGSTYANLDLLSIDGSNHQHVTPPLPHAFHLPAVKINGKCNIFFVYSNTRSHRPIHHSTSTRRHMNFTRWLPPTRLFPLPPPSSCWLLGLFCCCYFYVFYLGSCIEIWSVFLSSDPIDLRMLFLQQPLEGGCCCYLARV